MQVGLTVFVFPCLGGNGNVKRTDLAFVLWLSVLVRTDEYFQLAFQNLVPKDWSCVLGTIGAFYEKSRVIFETERMACFRVARAGALTHRSSCPPSPAPRNHKWQNSCGMSEKKLERCVMPKC